MPALTASDLGLAVAGALALYALLVGALVVAGRRDDARALARLVPDLALLFRRLLTDPRVPRSRKLMLAATVAYLASPMDLVPDFIPVAGALDDALIVALALRVLLRGAGRDLVTEHWTGSPEVLRMLLGLAGPARAA